ncbi:hypothetical protein ABK040_009897 [Willaertia magna]
MKQVLSHLTALSHHSGKGCNKYTSSLLTKSGIYSSIISQQFRTFSSSIIPSKSNVERFLESELNKYSKKYKKEETKIENENNKTEPTTTEHKTSKFLTNPEAYSNFLKLKLSGPISKALTHFLKFEEPTQIQKEVIPKALSKVNIIASAETGTGKTAAFGLPILQKLIEKKRKGELPIESNKVHCLILCPTKELSEQVHEHFNNYAKYTLQVMEEEGVTINDISINTGLIFGGVSINSQLKNIKKGVDVLVATPGRVVELLKKHSQDFNLDNVKYFVLDECDKMLNMGFLPELKKIFNHLPKPVSDSKDNMQTLMFSATLTKDIEDLMLRIAPNHHLVNLNEEFKIPETIKHVKYFVSKKEMKFKLLLYLLKRKGSLRDKKVLIFCRTKDKVQRLAENLTNRGYKAIPIHKDKSISYRTKAIKSFSAPHNDECQILISTDVLARGIDVPDLPVVINYDVPAKPEDYIHRVGRTGRAGHEGMAFSFVSKTPTIVEIGGRLVEINEEHFIKNIEQLLAKKVEHRKIPGEWLDPYINNLEEEAKKVEELSKKKALEILARKKKKAMTNSTEENEDEKVVSKYSESFNRIKQKVSQTKTLTGEDLKFAPTLRHFKEGRYEDVMKEFEVKRAIKEGVVKKVKPKPFGKKKKKKFEFNL